MILLTDESPFLLNFTSFSMIGSTFMAVSHFLLWGLPDKTSFLFPDYYLEKVTISLL